MGKLEIAFREDLPQSFGLEAAMNRQGGILDSSALHRSANRQEAARRWHSLDLCHIVNRLTVTDQEESHGMGASLEREKSRNARKLNQNSAAVGAGWSESKLRGGGLAKARTNSTVAETLRLLPVRNLSLPLQIPQPLRMKQKMTICTQLTCVITIDRIIDSPFMHYHWPHGGWTSHWLQWKMVEAEPTSVGKTERLRK